MYVSVAVVFDGKGRLLLRQRGVNGVESGTWELPGGFIEPGELPETAVCRELFEETGVHGVASKLIGVVEWSAPAHGTVVLLFYEVVPSQNMSSHVRGVLLPSEDAGQLDLPPPDRLMVTALVNVKGRVEEIIPQGLCHSNLPSVWDMVWRSSDRYAHPRVRRSRIDAKLSWFRELGHHFHQTERILDLGCGPGYALDALLDNSIAPYYLGTDRSSIAIAQALNRHRRKKADFLWWQKDSLPFPSGTFTTVLALGVLEHQRDPSVLLNEIRRVLVTGGELLLVQSSTRTWFYPARLLRQAMGFWPYGFQRNISYARLERLLREAGFAVCGVAFKHSQPVGDKLLPYLDRIVGIFWSEWRRYIVVRCTAA